MGAATRAFMLLHCSWRHLQSRMQPNSDQNQSLLLRAKHCACYQVHHRGCMSRMPFRVYIRGLEESLYDAVMAYGERSTINDAHTHTQGIGFSMHTLAIA